MNDNTNAGSVSPETTAAIEALRQSIARGGTPIHSPQFAEVFGAVTEAAKEIDDDADPPAAWYMVAIPVLLLTLAFGLPIAWLLWLLVQ